jgi:methionyl-tRNA synthetase
MKKPAGAAPAKKEPPVTQERALVTYDEFKKLDIRVAKILSAERIEGATKLLKLTVDAGEEQPRTVVAGIAEHYKPEELPGRSIVLLANLQPAKIRGVESQGMLLAADVDGRAILLQPDAPQDVPAGATVR